MCSNKAHFNSRPVLQRCTIFFKFKYDEDMNLQMIELFFTMFHLRCKGKKREPPDKCFGHPLAQPSFSRKCAGREYFRVFYNYSRTHMYTHRLSYLPRKSTMSKSSVKHLSRRMVTSCSSNGVSSTSMQRIRSIHANAHGKCR